jgi:hypothetical protein
VEKALPRAVLSPLWQPRHRSLRGGRW